MTDINALQDAFMKADKLAQQGDEQARQDATMFAAEIRRLQAAGAASKGSGAMSQVNAGIAESLGGLVDFVNPFDGDEFGFSTGSAQDGLRRGMNAVGIETAEGDPEGIVQGFARGSGRAAGALVPAAGGFGALRGVGGVIGGLSDDAARSLTSTPGAATEIFAGGIGGGASEAAEDAGAPEWVQNTLEIAAPAAALPLASKVAKTVSPAGYLARKGGEAIAKAAAPYTKKGGRLVAQDRLQSLAGGEERAADLAKSIGDTEIGLTPAQQTGDKNLLALEQQAGRENPELRERLEAKAQDATERAVEGVDIGASPDAAREFFDRRLSGYKKRIGARVDRVTQMADESVEGVGPRSSETVNSETAVERVKAALDVELQREAELWRAVPVEARVPTDSARDTALSLWDELPRAQKADFPKVAQSLLVDEGGLGQVETVSELHGLYSEMRRVARSAMAGNDQNKNRARVANEIAESILNDLGAIDASTEAGQAINNARAFSKALHETFDRGAAGRVLKRTLDGDETMTPESALRRTIGGGGADAVAADRSLTSAARDTAQNIDDYLRGQFQSNIFDASGGFTPKKARAWMRGNAELLTRYPDLRGELARALRNRDAAEGFANRAAGRAKATDKSASGRFLNASPDQAVSQVFGAAQPLKAARELAKQAGKDPSGSAMAGVKGAFSRNLIDRVSTPDGEGAKISGQQFVKLLNKNQAALREIYNDGEMKRLRRIASEVVKLERAQKSQGDIGSVSDATPNKMIEFVLRIGAARTAAKSGGGMAGGLQAAQMASSRMRDMVRGLTNDKATQILMDAIEDPALMRALLSDPKSIRLEPEIVNRLSPYFVGAAANSAADE